MPEVHTANACSAGQLTRTTSAAARSRLGLPGVLGQQSETGGGLAPDDLQVLSDRVGSALLQVVDPARALSPLRDHPRVLEQPEVAGDGGPADGHRVGDLLDRLAPVAENTQDLPPVGVTQRL